MAARNHRNTNKIPDQWPVVWEVDIVMKNEQCEHRLRVDPKIYKARLPGGITGLAMF